jgi:hypothetical protein
MSALFQAGGALAIALGFAGTWLAARNVAGWLVCIVSSALWLPALITGAQWVAVLNCAVSMAICARNFVTQSASPRQLHPVERSRGADDRCEGSEPAAWVQMSGVSAESIVQ